MDDNQLTPEQEQLLDDQFQKDLHEYVNNLPLPSPEDIAIYNQKFDFLTKLHNEIKAVYPDFQPEYDPIEEFTDHFPKGKYSDTTYSVNISTDSDTTE